jgi:hypothetical protein
MISTNPGFTVASRSPRRNRFVAMPAKERHAGVVMRTMPYQPVNEGIRIKLIAKNAYPADCC